MSTALPDVLHIAALEACDDTWVKLRSLRLIVAGRAEAWRALPTDRNLAAMRAANTAALEAETVCPRP